jgi:hypothetical protein
MSGWGLPQVTGVALVALYGVSAGQALASGILSLAAHLPVYLAGAAVLLAEAHRRKRSDNAQTKSV